MTRTLVDGDDFTGTVDTIGTGWSIFRNQNILRDGSGSAYMSANSATNGSYRNTGAYASAQYAMAKMTAASNGGAGHRVAPLVRGQSEGNGYVAIIRTTTVDLYKVVAGAFNLLSNVAGAQSWAADDEFFLDVEDNGSAQPVFSIWKNTTQIGANYTDTGASPYTGGRPGLLLYQDSTPNVLVTYWEGGDYSSSGGGGGGDGGLVTRLGNQLKRTFRPRPFAPG